MYHKFLVFVILATILWIPSEGSTPIRKCREDIPPPHFVQINDCETYLCNLFPGSSANMTIQFSAVNDTKNIHAEVVNYVNDNPCPFQMPNDTADVCEHLDNNARCPLNAGDKVTYSLSVPLDKSLPDAYVETEVALVDENGNCVSCFVVDVHVNGQKYHSEKASDF